VFRREWGFDFQHESAAETASQKQEKGNIMAKQTSTENIRIIRKHTWQVPFRISLYEIADGCKFVLLEGGRRKSAPLTRNNLMCVEMEASGVTAYHANSASTIL